MESMHDKLTALTPNLFNLFAETEVRYRDLDTFKHVNNAVYLSYMEFGRLKYMRRFLEGMIDWKEKGFILGTNHIVYVHPLFLFDKVKIFTGVGKIGNRSVTFVNLLTNGEGKHVAYAYSVLVSYNFEEEKSIPVPEEWREVFEKTDEKLLKFFEKEILR